MRHPEDGNWLDEELEGLSKREQLERLEELEDEAWEERQEGHQAMMKAQGKRDDIRRKQDEVISDDERIEISIERSRDYQIFEDIVLYLSRNPRRDVRLSHKDLDSTFHFVPVYDGDDRLVALRPEKDVLGDHGRYPGWSIEENDPNSQRPLI